MKKVLISHYQIIHGKEYHTSTWVYASSTTEAKAVIESKFPNHRIV